MTDFLSLLKEQPEAAIATRLDYLEEKAKAARLDIESAKLSSLALTLVGFGLSANPLVAVIGGIGALGYVGSLVTDYMATGRFCPVPALRKGVGELLSGFSNAGDDYDPDPDVAEVEALASCLPPKEAKEFWLLSRSSERLLGHLLPMAPEQRLNAYGLAVRNPRVLGTSNPALPAVTPHQALPPAQESQSNPAPEQTPTPPEQPPEMSKGTIGPTTRLGAISVPAAPATPNPSPSPTIQQWDEDEPLETSQQADGVALLQECLHYPSILVFGAPGAGKSTLAEWLIYQRIELGHQVEILDPHRKYGQWEGLPTYGDGMNFSECDERLASFLALVESRYRQRAKRPDFNPRPVTVLTEEFTQWSKRCKWSASFFETSVSDIRKINMHVVYVSHGRTMTAIGGAKGLAETRDAALLEIGLDAQVDPETGEASPTGTGRLYYPGRKNKPVEIVVPNLAIPRPATEQPVSSSTQKQRQNTALESAYFADSSDESVAIVREVLIKADEPLKASQIKQKNRTFKDGMETKELEVLLQRMALEGFIVQTDETPPRFTVS